MYCVDYQMSYPLLVVPYAPLKTLKSNDFGAFFFINTLYYSKR